MGMCASLTRIKYSHLEHMLDQPAVPVETEETVDVDTNWECINYVFGNGFVGARITGDIFMPVEVIGEEEEIKYGGGIRYHTPEAIQKINEKIGHLTEINIRERIVPEKMTQVYKFEPDGIDWLVEMCFEVIALFKRAEENGDIVVAGIG